MMPMSYFNFFQFMAASSKVVPQFLQSNTEQAVPARLRNRQQYAISKVYFELHFIIQSCNEKVNLLLIR